MQSNTKLTAEQKEILREMREIQDGAVQVLNLDNKTTMAFMPKGNTVEFALSVMSDNEKKFRPKVGEYFARCRFENDETVKMEKHDFMRMCETVWDAYPI